MTTSVSVDRVPQIHHPIKSVSGFSKFISASIAATLLMVTSLSHADINPKELRIGYQKYGTLLLLKADGALDKRLAQQGVTVKWTEFPGGPQLLEGLNVGAIDYGVVGEAPPIFAQAAGAPIVYIANEPPAPAGEAVVVQKNSTIKSFAELKGKKIALNKGSNVHYLLVKLLEKYGIAYKDIQPIYLAPADARAAFERGAVDAWVIWDPFLAAAQQQIGAKVIADGKNLVNNTQFYLASRSYASARPDVLSVVLDETAKKDIWVSKNIKDAATALSPSVGLSSDILELSFQRSGFGVKPVTPAVLAQQQQIADVFYQQKLIPKPLKVADAALKK
ncbi:sulfonate ABC transporter substrate-binding protein [Aquirhabdus sp.]|uniref:sulfonate ABC transporter substrate-binding protein n=1 Tax=Aquirhabdus sp. TaxID=2824160 RepID=UPI00396C7CB5